MKLTLEKQVPLVFCIAMLLLVIIGFFAFRSMNTLSEALKRENHTQEVLLELDETLISTVDTETNGRGFLITGDEIFLESYNQGQAKISQSLTKLRALVADNPNQTERIPKLENEINERLVILKQHVNVRRTQSLGEVPIVSTLGREKMNSVRLLIDEMKNEEKNLRTQRAFSLDESRKTTYALILFTGIAGLIALSLATLAVFREINKRRTAETELRDANKDLEQRVEERAGELSQKNEELAEQTRQREYTEKQHKIALEAGNLGTWKLDPHINKIEIDERGMSLFGFSAEDFDGDVFGRVHEEDYPRIQELFQKSVRDKAFFNAEFRVLTADGELRWNNCVGQPQLDENGQVAYIVGNCRDITEQREAVRVRQELLELEQAARKEAEIANRVRDEFLATVSHELRAPLNSILGWGRLLEKGNLDGQTSAKAIKTIVRNAESQNRLIEDLLDVSRIISGKLRLEVMTIKPINFVESALETVRPAAEAKGITLEIKEDSVVSHISGDPNRLQQVVWNLLSNAIKFTPNGGKVTVEIERANGYTEIRIKDSGIGISREFLPHVFDRFRQADASSIRKFGGLGLGLAIVRYIAEMHGGTVFAESAGENKGATFTIRLPVITAPKDEPENEIKEVSGIGLSEILPKLSLDGLLILVVDDEEDTRQLLVQILTSYGATVVAAGSAAEGLSELQDKNPDVLVSDIGMPDEDGYSLIRKIRALPDEHHKNTKAIALTAFTRARDRMRALAAGFQNHVGKPVEPDELATVIASLTGRLLMDES